MVLPDLDSDDSDGARSVLSVHSHAHDDTRAQALPAPLSNPDASHKLTSGEYDCLDDLLEDLHEHGVTAGFSVCKIRSNNYVKGFGPTRVDIGCGHGKMRAPRGQSRNTSTTKKNCTWQAVAKALLVNGARKWMSEALHV